MIELNYTFFVQLLNFLILLSVLNLILYRPIRGVIRKRAEVMHDKLLEIENFTADAEAKLENYKAALGGARTEAQKIRLALKTEGSATEAAVLSTAGSEAAGRLAVARKDVEAQKETALQTLRGAVNGYAQAVVGKVLSRN